MENSPFAFLASLTGKPAGDVFAKSKALLAGGPGQEFGRADGEGFLSFLEDLLTPVVDADADAANALAAPPAFAGALLNADVVDGAPAPASAPVDSISAVAAPIEGFAAPVIDAASAPVIEAASAQAPGAAAAAALAPMIPAQARVETKAPLSARPGTPAKPPEAVLPASAKKSDPPAKPVSGLSPVAVKASAETAMPEPSLEQAAPIEIASEQLPRTPRIPSSPRGLSGNTASNATFALSENAAPEAFANAAITRGEGDLANIEILSGRRLEALARTDAPAANVMPVRDQIVAAVASRPGETRLEVRLDPPELGKVTITFDGDGADIVRAVVHAEAPQTLDLMRRHADVFQRALEAQGFENLDLQFSERAPRENPGDKAQEQLRSFLLAEEEAALLADVTAPQVAPGRLDRRM
jgi:hypothetical protein